MSLFGNKYHPKLDEKEIIKLLISWKDSSGFPDLRPFVNMMLFPDDFGKEKPYTGYYVKENILRTHLNFDKGSKPGDFDVIIIPFRGELVFFNRAAVYEIKVVRPTRAKPSKNANSLGLTQLNGLISDGFPFVGLIHICMPEPLTDEEKLKILMHEKVFNDYSNYKNNRSIDQFGNYSCDKQMQRLLNLSIPKFAGIAAYSLELYERGLYIGSCSQSYLDYQKGYFNPERKQETIDNLIEYFYSNQSSFRRKELRTL